MIYFDNAATTYPKPEEVYKVANDALRNYGVNAGRGSYRLSKKAYEIIRDAKEKLLTMINGYGENSVVFSPSATIALNQIINGLEWNEYTVVYISPFEHNAIVRPLQYLKKRFGFRIEMIPFKIIKEKNKNKIVFDENEFRKKVYINKPDYLFVSHVSNVTGYELPIEKIIEISKASNSECIVTIDCAQSMGLIDINLDEIRADYLVFAGHKTLYGIFGIGGFIKNTSKDLKEFIVGGTGSDSLNLDMPTSGSAKYEAGSVNIQAVAALNSSLEWIKNAGIKNIRNHERKLVNMLIYGLNEIDGVTIYVDENEDRQNGILAFNLKGYKSEQLAEILDEEFDICVRAGYHCAPYVHDLIGTKADGEDLAGVVRVSFSCFNSSKEVEHFIEIIRELYDDI